MIRSVPEPMYEAITGSAPLKTDLIELAVNRIKAAYWATSAMVLNHLIKEQAQRPLPEIAYVSKLMCQKKEGVTLCS